MKIVQTVTDYIRRSILTATGDIPVRGAYGPERLAAGAVGTILRGKGVGVLPVYDDFRVDSGGLAFGSGTLSTTGDEVITGVGFNPSVIIIFGADITATNKNWSLGVDDATKRINIYSSVNGAEVKTSIAQCFMIYRDLVNHIHGSVSAKSSDGFTLSCTIAGTVNASFNWFAVK